MAFSFRDPSGSLADIEGRIVRFVKRSSSADLQSFLRSTSAQKLTERRQLVRSDTCDDEATRRAFEVSGAAKLFGADEELIAFEHERIFFPSFPYEWPTEMLDAAARLTLDISEAILHEGFGLKDATPFNILFRGAQPVFVDLLSFERRDPHDPVWLPDAQFVRTFLLPLLVARRFDLSAHQLFGTRREGLEPDEVYKLAGAGWRKFLPPELTLVSIPAWLARGQKPEHTEIYRRKSLSNPEQARFILEQLFRRLRRNLASVAPRASRKSQWSDYMTPDKNFTRDYFSAKQEFVAAALGALKARRVLDVGCNTGHFSRLAAKLGASVVAIDADGAVVGEAWRRASEEGSDVLPLVVNIAQPTPATGWRNEECASFVERARGSFDAVLMLSLIHHLLVSERVPLHMILELAAELTIDACVVEFVPTDDPKFRQIVRGRDALFEYFTQEFFEEACRRCFEIADCAQLADTGRRIYLLRRKKKGAEIVA